MKTEWYNVKEKIPPNGIRVLKFSSICTRSQEDTAITIVTSDSLRVSDETVYWTFIPEPPVELTLI